MTSKSNLLITFLLMSNLLLAKREDFAVIRDRVNAAASTWTAELYSSINYEDAVALRRRAGALSRIDATEGNDQIVEPTVVVKRPRLLQFNNVWNNLFNNQGSNKNDGTTTTTTTVNGVTTVVTTKIVNGVTTTTTTVNGVPTTVIPDNNSVKNTTIPTNNTTVKNTTTPTNNTTVKNTTTPTTNVVITNNTNNPDTLDLRLKYPQCKSILFIRDQGVCGSCWAFSTMNSISDRYCIANYNNDSSQRSFAPQDVMECCAKCSTSATPCDGGYLDYAMSYAKTTGISTGEEYGNYNLCKPYFLSPNAYTYGNTQCASTCTNTKTYTTPLSSDRYKIPGYSSATGETAMIAALNNGGTIAATFDIYEDFYTYKSGIYSHLTGSNLGGHAVRIIGYGTEKGVKYWLVANSWGGDWGEKGYFRFRRGNNECNIEKNAAYYAVF